MAAVQRHIGEFDVEVAEMADVRCGMMVARRFGYERV